MCPLPYADAGGIVSSDQKGNPLGWLCTQLRLKIRYEIQLRQVFRW